jgi:hypothetical protein
MDLEKCKHVQNLVWGSLERCSYVSCSVLKLNKKENVCTLETSNEKINQITYSLSRFSSVQPAAATAYSTPAPLLPSSSRREGGSSSGRGAAAGGGGGSLLWRRERGGREGGPVPCSPKREEVWGEQGGAALAPPARCPGIDPGKKTGAAGGFWRTNRRRSVQRPRSSGEAWNGKRSTRES